MTAYSIVHFTIILCLNTMVCLSILAYNGKVYVKFLAKAELQYVTGFWKTYHLHTNEIIRISDFEPLWL